MARAKTVTVQLGEYLRDQDPQALKGLVSAPIAYRLNRLINIAKTERVLGDIGPVEMISALLHATKPDAQALRQAVEEYRNAQVWQTRDALGEPTEAEGGWRIRLRGPGESWG
jgi:hypothetical protein